MISKNSVLSATEAATPIWQNLSLTEQKNISDRMEQWFADIEKHNQPNNIGTNSYLATQFLSYFGLKNAAEVFEFLKTTGGNVTLTMIAREIMKEEARIESIRERNTEAMLSQQRHLIFLLMGIIAEREELAKNVDQLIRLEIDKHLPKGKHEQSQETTFDRTPLQMIEDMIAHYVETIKVLDEKLDELERQLEQVEEELAALEEEGRRMDAYHEALHTHIDILDAYLQLPIFKHPQGDPTAFSAQRISILVDDLKRYKAQEELYKSTVSDDPQIHEVEKRRLSRQIKTIEHELSFHKVHLNQTTTNYEQLFRFALEQTRAKIREHQSIPGQLDPEMEGLKLRERGLVSALNVMNNKKILLNDKLEQVFDYSQARFSMKHEDAKFLVQTDNGSYALLPKDKDPNQLTEEDWIQAKRDFEQAKERIQTPRYNCLEKIQENLQKHIHRYEQPLNLREVLKNQKSEMQRARDQMGETLRETRAQKVLLSRNPRLSHTPKTDAHASYSQMIEKFESLVLKAPKEDDIEKARNIVESSTISPKNKGELNKLIEQVSPEKIMESQQRLQWLYSAKRLIKDTTPTPNVDPTLPKKD
ncbi:hypothetical protein OQJ13_14040 [Legionella sp. PATHC035]|uniref:hypothetical protein n=1 Tax=Legionella sp. PATHC035 TaxID=2992040 RepID=UPI0022443392|nr:hypothetical protein [Legionella sp. PATHC035]MCW8410096.1 hypothetical protein [Legionella sp. PATHC035]